MGNKIGFAGMIKSGTTCFNEMYWYEEATIEAIEEMRIRAIVGLVLLDFWPLGSKEHIERIFKKLKTERLKTIKLAIVPHSIYTVSKENLVLAKNFAKKDNLPLHTHLAETEKEVKDCQRKYKVRPVEFLEKIGFLNEKTILAHSIWLSDREIEILKKRKSSLVYNHSSI